MSSSYSSVALAVAWRHLHNLVKNPPLLVPSLIFPLFFFAAFAFAAALAFGLVARTYPVADHYRKA